MKKHDPKLRLLSWVLLHSGTVSAAKRTSTGSGKLYLLSRAPLWICAGVLNLVAWSPAVWAAAMNDVALVANRGPNVTDAAFASMAAGALINKGTPTAANATFLFQECYGGGMIDNLSDALGATLPWVAGSASSSTETSAGQWTNAEGAGAYGLTAAQQKAFQTSTPVFQTDTNPSDFWTTQLAGQLGTPTQATMTSISNANTSDPIRTGQNVTVSGWKYAETPQLSFANGGDKIALQNAAVPNLSVVLWAGDPNFARHGNDITGVYNALSAIPKTTVSFQILYGNGTAPGGVKWTDNGAATSANLQTTFNGLTLNKDTGFLFYATDHGTPYTPVKTDPSPVKGKNSDTENYNIDPTELTDILGDSDAASLESPAGIFNPFEPYVEVDYDGVQSDGSVAVLDGDGTLLGYLPSSDTVMDFNIPYSDLGTSDSFEFENGASSSFDLDAVTFWGGSDGGDPNFASVPEPASAALALTFFTGLTLRRKR